jgi:hypothetical protein
MMEINLSDNETLFPAVAISPYVNLDQVKFPTLYIPGDDRIAVGNTGPSLVFDETVNPAKLATRPSGGRTKMGPETVDILKLLRVNLGIAYREFSTDSRGGPTKERISRFAVRFQVPDIVESALDLLYGTDTPAYVNTDTGPEYGKL